MSTITKEWLQQKIADMEAARDEIPFGLGEDDSNTLAALRIALASLEAEPVAYMYKDNLHSDARFSLHTRFGNWSQEDINEYEITEIPLYAAPPTPASVPDDSAITQHFDTIALETAREIMCDVSRRHEFLGGEVQLLSRIQCRIDDACRAAMLQGAEPVTTAYKLPVDFDFNRFNDVVWLEAVASNPHMHSLTTSTIAMVALELNKRMNVANSLAIPDGWVMVPVEPTEDMIVNGFDSEPDESFSDEKEWEAYDAMSGCQQAAHRAKLCWAAMIAAAPKV
ncbi:hypothetical protein WP8W19C02_19950 [Enterobacter cloacae]|nr:hypothetical protein WP8W19C02_19950 [Enterobacter cloacae]